MKPFHSWIWVCVFTLAPGAFALPQQEVVKADSVEIATGQSEAPAASAEVSVLRLVKLSGVVQDALGQPRTGVVGITFALYQEQEGGAPLWLETQNARLDAQGRYTVLLGAESSEGLPLEIFSSTEARWLEVTVLDETSSLPAAGRPRILLVSVPYALKAADSDSLGGKPASAFVVAESTGAQSSTTADTTQAISGPGTTALTVDPGTVGDIVKYTGAPDTLGPATTFVETGGKVGIGTTTPTVGKLQVSAGTGPSLYLSSALRYQVGLNNSGDPAREWWFISDPSGDFALHENLIGDRLTVQNATGNVGIGTTTPTVGKLQVSAGAGPSLYLSSALRYQVGLNNSGDAAREWWVISDTNGDFALHENLIGDRLTVQNATGRVGIGTTSPSEKLHVVGNVIVSGDVTATSLTEISSRRWKSNIQPLRDALEKVERLRGVTYDLNSNNRHDIGLIAEEVGEVVPEVVVQDENGRAKAVNYGRLTALLVEAVKEQQAQIRTLQEELAAMKAGHATPAGRP